MPEEEPLQAFTPPNIISEAELRLLVTFFEEVKQLGCGLHHRKRRVLGVVNKDRDSSCGYG